MSQGAWIALLFFGPIFGFILYSIYMGATAAKISIRFKDDNKIFRPGDTIEGVMVISAEKRGRVKEAFISLKCHEFSHRTRSASSSGRRSRDAYWDKVVLATDFDVGLGPDKELPFSIKVPEKFTPQSLVVSLLPAAQDPDFYPGLQTREEIENPPAEKKLERGSTYTWRLDAWAHFGLYVSTKEEDIHLLRE